MKNILCFILAVLVACLLCCCKSPNEQNDISQESNPLVDTVTPEIPEDEQIPEVEDNKETEEQKTDVSDITGLYEVPGDYEVTLYFPDSDFLYLHPESRIVNVSEGENLVTIIVNELFKGPESSELFLALTGENLINYVTVSADGICTIDFKSDFAVLNTGGTTGEAFAIGSIVNSVCELDGIEKVKFNIDGNDKAEIGGHNTLEAPVSPQIDLIKK